MTHPLHGESKVGHCTIKIDSHMCQKFKMSVTKVTEGWVIFHTNDPGCVTIALNFQKLMGQKHYFVSDFNDSRVSQNTNIVKSLKWLREGWVKHILCTVTNVQWLTLSGGVGVGHSIDKCITAKWKVDHNSQKLSIHFLSPTNDFCLVYTVTQDLPNNMWSTKWICMKLRWKLLYLPKSLNYCEAFSVPIVH